MSPELAKMILLKHSRNGREMKGGRAESDSSFQEKLMRYIIKLFPEIMIKGASVKKKMTAQLADNLKRMLAQRDMAPRVKRFLDKIEVEVADARAAQAEALLMQTPGIEQVLRVRQFRLAPVTLEEIARIVVEQAAERVRGKTFVVRAKRKGQHAFTSQEIERFVGGALLKTGQTAGVDLHQPQVRVELEVENNTLSLIDARLKGLGGYPLGSQGEALSLVSGGFDSTVASYLTMRRGIKTHFLFFNLGGLAHDIGVKQVSYYLWQRFGSSHRVKFISVPFEGGVEGLLTQVPDSYMGVMLKRLMLMAAERSADEMGLDALVTGESVAQVSSQTLRNLALIDRATGKLVLRPLAMMDKPQIIRLADRIGTRAFAETMPEYCGVISRNPVTHGSFKKLAEAERRFDFALLDAAVDGREVFNVDELVDQINAQQAVPVVSEVDAGDVIIDIRAPEQAGASPLSEAALHIPFHELARRFPQLDQNRRYLLYCDKGVLSQLHGQHLRAEGFRNVFVYRPEPSDQA